MKALTDYDPASLRAAFASWGHRPAHADRLLKAFYDSNGRIDPGKLGIGNALAAQVGESIKLRQSSLITQAASADGAVKLLIGLDGGGEVEAVLMPSHRPDRAAGCISSQIGCAMGCGFCASTRNGLERDLSAGEIVEQFLHLREEAAATGRRLSTLVFMGMGEPLLNLQNVIVAIQRIAAPGMGALGGRQITVSTVGIVPGIERLAEANLNVHLAISLHAADDATRTRLVPANRRYNVAQIMSAARRFQQHTGRVVNIEYCLLAGINDSEQQANLLADLMVGFRAHVNLIPYNEVDDTRYRRPTEERMQRFLGILRDRGVVTHFRRPRGDDVGAACGQLRSVHIQGTPDS